MKINITSSMKYIDLQGLKPREIILKYEEMLYQRENQIKEITDQLTDSQQKLLEVNDKYQQLFTKNKELIETKSKYEKTLNQQRTDKDLLFIKLNNLISENDKLKSYISGNTSGLKPPAQQQQNPNIKKENKQNNIHNLNKKIEDNKININENLIINDLKEKNIEKEKDKKEEDKKEDKHEDKKEESSENNKNSITENDDEKEKNKKNEETKEEEAKSKSEKKLIVVNPEEYLARRKKKHKGPKKLLSEKVSYDPVFK